MHVTSPRASWDPRGEWGVATHGPIGASLSQPRDPQGHRDEDGGTAEPPGHELSLYCRNCQAPMTMVSSLLRVHLALAMASS